MEALGDEVTCPKATDQLQSHSWVDPTSIHQGLVTHTTWWLVVSRARRFATSVGRDKQKATSQWTAPPTLRSCCQSTTPDLPELHKPEASVTRAFSEMCSRTFQKASYYRESTHGPALGDCNCRASYLMEIFRRVNHLMNISQSYGGPGKKHLR